MDTNPAYAGIGSRRVPIDIARKMTIIASEIQDHYILRSGHADGSDQAFERGISNGRMEIYIPWKGFAGSSSKLYTQPKEAFEIASEYHPNWKNLTEPVRKLMARNVMQVLGADLQSPVRFVICWTPDGCISKATRSRDTGGTGQAISIASDRDIPVINMQHILWKEILIEHLGYLE